MRKMTLTQSQATATSDLDYIKEQHFYYPELRLNNIESH